MSDAQLVEARIRALADEDLLRLIGKPNDYTSEAVAIARDEVSRRGGREHLEVRVKGERSASEEHAAAEQRAASRVRVPRRSQLLRPWLDRSQGWLSTLARNSSASAQASAFPRNQILDLVIEIRL